MRLRTIGFLNLLQIFSYRQDFQKIEEVFSTSLPSIPRSLAFSSNGDYFAVGSNNDDLNIFSLKEILEANKEKTTPTIYCISELHKGAIYCLEWSHSSRILASGSNDSNIKLTQFTKEEDEDFV